MTPQLCLGTVQFGQAYGITNSTGQVSQAEVKRILDLAMRSGVTLFDTAQSYGESESVLGRCWPQKTKPCLISKLPAGAAPESWEQNFQDSLQRLGVETLDSFLLHRPADLRGTVGIKLLKWLESLRDRSLVKRIGVSIYEASDLGGLPLKSLQVVQLPLSLYDQRLLRNGTIASLKELGISIHARSIMLQGLLVQPVDHWPACLSTSFREHHQKLTAYLRDRGMSLLDAAIGFVRSCEYLETVLIGVQSHKELEQLLHSWNNATSLNAFIGNNWEWSNNKDLDPRQWIMQAS